PDRQEEQGDAERSGRAADDRDLVRRQTQAKADDREVGRDVRPVQAVDEEFLLRPLAGEEPDLIEGHEAGVPLPEPTGRRSGRSRPASSRPASKSISVHGRPAVAIVRTTSPSAIAALIAASKYDVRPPASRTASMPC